jgi:hypothetical protein
VLPQHLTIHENDGLLSLTVDFGHSSHPVFDSMATILLQISSPHIRVITIHARPGGAIKGDGSDFMDEIISRPMFSGLKSVSFHISYWLENNRQEWSWFKQKLPLCAARGILSVSFCSRLAR